MIPYNSKHDSLTDRELLVRMRDNSTNAFDTVYERYHRELYAYALKLLKSPDDASDIIQDTFIKLWENSDSLPDEVNLRFYLRTMVRNKVWNHMRDNKARLLNNYSIMFRRGMSEENPGPGKVDDTILSEELERAIGQLPPQQRKVAVLRREGLSNAEIAKRMDLSVNTVNVHYRLMLNFLKGRFRHLVLLIMVYSLW